MCSKIEDGALNYLKLLVETLERFGGRIRAEDYLRTPVS